MIYLFVAFYCGYGLRCNKYFKHCGLSAAGNKTAEREETMKKRLTTAAMAATMAFSTFGGINVFANETKSDQELVKLRLIFYGDASSRRDEFFKNEFHDAVLEDLNIDL